MIFKITQNMIFKIIQKKQIKPNKCLNLKKF